MKKKLLTHTLPPIVIGLLIAGILIVVIACNQIQTLQNQNMKNSSLTVAYQISEYFTKYMEVSRQMGADQELKNLFMNTKSGSLINESEEYAPVMKMLMNTHHTDTDNILGCWTADVDSGQCIEDNGYVSEIGEWDITTKRWDYDRENKKI